MRYITPIFFRKNLNSIQDIDRIRFDFYMDMPSPWMECINMLSGSLKPSNKFILPKNIH